MAREQYAAQVHLLVRALPIVARETCFALKGGTAINLFYRDMPRLSVDIDLTYLPIEDRPTSLAGIDEALNRIESAIQSELSGTTATRIAGGGNEETRVLVRLGRTEIKIETSPVLRGTVHAPELRVVTDNVEDAFGFAEMSVVSFEDLYGGKLTAALDRQHPRDLYDVKLLYENEGVSDDLFRTFLIYVASSNRPPHEILRPSLSALDRAFVREFEGMTNEPVTLDALKETRLRLIDDVRARLDHRAKRFLLSLHDGQPDFTAIDLPDAASLPAVRWKVQNLVSLKTNNANKHAEQRKLLEDLF